MLARIGIGTKILLVVGIVFALFAVGLALLIGATSFNNLTQMELAELDRTSHILARQVEQMERNAVQAARRFEGSEPLITQVQLLTERGPYYADPGSYFESDFSGAGAPIEDADKIYVFRAQLELIQLLLSVQQLNSFSSIGFYHLSPFDVVADARPALAFRLDEERIVLSQFQHKGREAVPHVYAVSTQDFQPPAPDYFDISSAYAFPPEDFYRENRFARVPAPPDVQRVFDHWRAVDDPVSNLIMGTEGPVLHTWYPVRAWMAHPATWEEEFVVVGIVQITQTLDVATAGNLAAQLGLDVAFAQENQLVVSSLAGWDAPSTRGDQGYLIGQDDTIAIERNAFNYAWQEIVFADRPTGLQAVVLSPVAELEGPTSVLRRRIIQMAGITVLLAGVILYLVLFYLLNRPLRELLEGVQRISSGNLNHAVAVPSRDEVGQLAMAFNRMAAQLRDLVGSLELRVDERTQELTAANRAAEIARRKAESANQAKSEFLSHISHELRTPLNGILGYAQILRRSDVLTPQQDYGLTIIQQSGEHLLTLINDVLDMTKIEAQKMELFPSHVVLQTFLNDLANIFRFRAQQKGLEFRCDFASDLPAAIYVDEKRLRQILINLLSNAIRYTSSGHVTFRVLDFREQSATQHAADDPSIVVRFQIEDTGMGMTTETVDAIFSPFEQLGDPAQREKGTGLGLTISQKLAFMMGSEIRVESARTLGSTFWFDLAVKPAPAVEESPTHGDRTIAGYQGRRRTILAVDDNLHNRSVITDLLRPLGFHVMEASGGAEAVDLARDHKPDFIFMDLRMAGMSGLEATRLIRREEDRRTFVIIAASASAFETDRDESLRAGCDGFMAKPVQAATLFALLEHHLGLDWIYAEEGTVSAGETPQATFRSAGDDVDPVDCAALPARELAVLLRLARQGLLREIREQADHLAALDDAYKPLSAHLHDLARRFREQEILALVERLAETAAGSPGAPVDRAPKV